MNNYEIALIEDSEERDALWKKYYFSKWEMSANRNHQPNVQAFWNDPGVAEEKLGMTSYLANNARNVGDALPRPTTKGPNDNWCYCEIGSLEDRDAMLCFGTYNSSDTLYCETYRNEYKKQNSTWVMSAGQPQDGSFQLCIWVGGIVIKHLDAVYYRDRIRVVKKRGVYYVVHCKGQFHPGKRSGTTKVYKIKCPIPKYIPPY